MSSYQIDTSGIDVKLRLSGDVTIEQAQAFHNALQAAIQPGQRLTVNAAAMTRLDAAALQVLLSAAKSASTVYASASSPAWEEAFRRFALEDPFTPIAP